MLERLFLAIWGFGVEIIGSLDDLVDKIAGDMMDIEPIYESD